MTRLGIPAWPLPALDKAQSLVAMPIWGGITARYFASRGRDAATQDNASGSVRNLAMRMWRNPRMGLLQGRVFGPN